MRIRLFYEHAGALYCEGERLPADSCEGAQQGDPLGPFIFALAFHATLQQVAAEYTTQGGGKTPPQTPPPTLSRRSTCRAQMRQTEELISARSRHILYISATHDHGAAQQRAPRQLHTVAGMRGVVAGAAARMAARRPSRRGYRSPGFMLPLAGRGYDKQGGYI